MNNGVNCYYNKKYFIKIFQDRELFKKILHNDVNEFVQGNVDIFLYEIKIEDGGISFMFSCYDCKTNKKIIHLDGLDDVLDRLRIVEYDGFTHMWIEPKYCYLSSSTLEEQKKTLLKTWEIFQNKDNEFLNKYFDEMAEKYGGIK